MALPDKVTMTNSQIPFRRDRATWGSYVMLALLTLQVTLIGPIMPFLRAEMGLSYAEGALHTSVFAIGMMAAGFMGLIGSDRKSVV